MKSRLLRSGIFFALSGLSLSFIAPFAFGPMNAWASDSARAKYETALSLFEQRADLSKNDEAIQVLEVAATEAADDPTLHYDILILSARAYYWKGMNGSSDAEKLALHQKGMEICDAAKKIISDPADAYYYYAIHLGRWALIRGVAASLGRKKELVANIQNTLGRKTRDGLAGETIDGFGPDRVLGRLYFKLPAFAGGSIPNALKHLSKATDQAGDYAINVTYLAEALFESGKKSEARQLLDDLLAKNPETLNPARVPETLKEFEEAVQVRRQMGN